MRPRLTGALIALLFLSVSVLSAQQDEASRPSPPAEAKGMIGKTRVSIRYSSPAVKGRKIWGGLVPYEKIWRTGANEATVFEISKDVKINGASLPAGKYALFTIPGEEVWTFIFNSVSVQWGAYRYNEKKDVLRVQAVPGPTASFQERLQFLIEGSAVRLQWENLEVGFDIVPEE